MKRVVLVMWVRVLLGKMTGDVAEEIAPCQFTTTPSGLAFCDKGVGFGPEASKGQLIKAHYTGKLEYSKSNSGPWVLNAPAPVYNRGYLRMGSRNSRRRWSSTDACWYKEFVDTDYPHITSGSRGRTSGKLTPNPGPSAADKTEKMPVRREMRDKFSGAVEAFARRNGSPAVHGDHPRHKSTEDVPLSKQVDTERALVSRTSSASKRAILSSSRPSSSAEFAENRSNRLGSDGRL